MRVHPARAGSTAIPVVRLSQCTRDIFINIKRQLHVEALGRGIIRFRLRVPVGTLRIVAQTLCICRGFRPPDTQRSAAFAEYRLVILAVITAIASQKLTKVVDAVSKAVLRQQRFDRVRLSAYPESRRPALAEQCGQMVIARAAASTIRTPQWPGKGHLGQRRQQTAAGTVVPASIAQRPAPVAWRHSSLFSCATSRTPAGLSPLTIDLRQRRCAQRVVALAAIDQQQQGVTLPATAAA